MMTMPAKRLFGLTFTLLLTAQAAFGKQTSNSDMRAFQRILKEVDSSGKFPAEDQRLVLNAFTIGNPSTRLLASFPLTAATSRGLFPKSKFFLLCEKNMTQPFGSRFVDDYATVMGFGASPGAEIDALYGLHSGRTPSTLNRDERRFAIKCLSSNKADIRVLAAQIFVTKRALDKPTYSWLINATKAASQRAKGSERDFWDCIIRVCVRNSGKAVA